MINCVIIPKHKNANALLAQLDRVFGYEPKGQGFESLAARQRTVIAKAVAVLFYIARDENKEGAGKACGRKASGGGFSPTWQRAKRGDRCVSTGKIPNSPPKGRV